MPPEDQVVRGMNLVGPAATAGPAFGEEVLRQVLGGAT